MCVIIDANQVGAVFGKRSGSAGAHEIWRWLLAGGMLVYGGKLKKELQKAPEASVRLAELKRAGRAHEQNSAEVDAEEARIHALCSSNDAHVVALARVSGARVLVSDDAKLIQDFKNAKLVSGPRGKVYCIGSSYGRSAARTPAVAVLAHSNGCPGNKRHKPRRPAGVRGRR